MNSEAKGGVSVFFTIDHHSVGVLKNVWISVGSRERKQDPVFFFHCISMKVKIVAYESCHCDGRISAQKFFNGSGDHVWIFCQATTIDSIGGEVPQ